MLLFKVNNLFMNDTDTEQSLKMSSVSVFLSDRETLLVVGQESLISQPFFFFKPKKNSVFTEQQQPMSVLLFLFFILFYNISLLSYILLDIWMDVTLWLTQTKQRRTL